MLTALSDTGRPDRDEFTTADFVDDGEDLDGVLYSIHHNHLPHLDDSSLIEWDRETNVVRKGPRFDEIQPLLRLLRDHADELPDDWM